jgi:hypothetical protein
MGIGNTFAGELLDHICINAAIALVGDASGLQPSAAAGSLYLALHTADPGGAGAQNTSEAAYGSYARQALARSGAGFSRSGQTVSNAGVVNFPQATSGSETLTHWSLGTASSGAGKILFSGPLVTGLKLFAAKTSDTLHVPGSAFAVDGRVVAFAVPGVSLPTGLVAGTVYWVKTASGEDITLSATQGGATLDITATGGGKIGLSKQLAVSNGIAPSVAIGAMTFLLG